MFTKNSIITLQILLLTLFTLPACRENDNPVSSFSVKVGSILFISNKSGSFQLYSMNGDGSNVQQLTTDSTFPIRNASWSPDGSKIAIQSSVGGVTQFGGALYIINADGTNKGLLTSLTVDGPNSLIPLYKGIRGAVWSPDSKEIAFEKTNIPEPLPSSDIFIIGIDGRNERRLATTRMVLKQVLDWSRDGNYITARLTDFSFPQLKERRVIYNLQGVEIKSWQGGGDLIYSTLGDKVAYYDGTIGVIFVMGADGSNVRSIKYNSDLSLDIITWSPGDSELLCNAGNRIFLLNLQTGILNDITPFKDYNGDQYATSWRKR